MLTGIEDADRLPRLYTRQMQARARRRWAVVAGLTALLPAGVLATAAALAWARERWMYV
jgi:hypothetical protein